MNAMDWSVALIIGAVVLVASSFLPLNWQMAALISIGIVIFMLLEGIARALKDQG